MSIIVCKKKLAALLMSTLMLVLLSGCSFFGNDPAPTISMPNTNVTPTPTAIGVAAPVCRLTACTNFTPVQGAHAWPDSWTNIHLFQTFDYDAFYYKSSAYDFHWGTEPNHVATYHNANPNMLTSAYMTFHADDGNGLGSPNIQVGSVRQAAYWVATGRKSWLLYRCDQKTPAVDFAEYTNAPLVINNPDVFNWQVSTYVSQASAYGYDTMAIDNLNMENQGLACGYFDNNGQWVQRYQGIKKDPQWASDVAAWVTKMQQAVHTQTHPLLLVGNFTYGVVGLDDPSTQATLAHLDGVLDEAGFTHFGQTRVSGDGWLEKIRFVNLVQQQNKPFFMINEEDNNVTPIPHEEIQWALASYLMCKQHMAFIYISQLGNYGDHTPALPEYKLPIGSPRGEMYNAQGVYWRDYTGGEVLVNSSNAVATVTLPAGTAYIDAYAAAVSGTITMKPNTGSILIKK